MTFNSTSTLSGVIQIYERFIDSGYAYVSGDTNRMLEATNLANQKSSEIWHIIHEATGNWQYDDSNNTDLPFATTDIVNAQRRYALPTEALTVQRVEAKDSSGNWTVLRPLIKESIPEALDEFHDENGTPMYYNLVDGVITLYPATNYASTDGLKVYYDREAVAFETSDTTKTPGFASPYHEILPVMMAMEWYNVKQPTSPTLVKLEQKFLRLEKALKDFYGKRFKDYKPRVGRAKVSYR
jgi:hypothetical protein